MARILVVDDEPDVRNFVARALDLHGHQIHEASDGAEALNMLERFRFDVVLSDIRMPVLDGISLALQIKSDQPNMKVLLMTGFSSELERAHNISQLIDGILTKPFTIDGLNEAVQHLFHANPWMGEAGTEHPLTRP